MTTSAKQHKMDLKNRYHFIGIGGIGMGALVSLLLAKGFKVSGSDLKESAMTSALRTRGAQILIGHDRGYINGADVVVYSSAVREDNPELSEARQKKLVVIKRAQLLSQLMENHIGITVAGAHGKTTTTSMISNMLIEAGLKPTTAIGGVIKGANGDFYNASVGTGQYFVAEVDESDGSFLFFHPRLSVITNIDFEHIDFYHNWENVLKAYKEYINHTEPEGRVIACGEDTHLGELLEKSKVAYTTYGFSEDQDIYADNVRLEGQGSRFDCLCQGERLGGIKLNVPGRHNILNALAAVCVGKSLAIDFDIIKKSMEAYSGVNRRFQLKGQTKDITVVDDYGHHPTEISATLEAARATQENRLVVVFQPHRYSRTKFLMDDFVRCLQVADYLIITDIYAASEEPLEGVDAQTLVRKLQEKGKTEVIYLPKEQIVEHLIGIVRPKDLVITLGAGDIYRTGEEFLAALGQPTEIKQG